MYSTLCRLLPYVDSTCVSKTNSPYMWCYNHQQGTSDICHCQICVLVEDDKDIEATKVNVSYTMDTWHYSKQPLFVHGRWSAVTCFSKLARVGIKRNPASDERSVSSCVAIVDLLCTDWCASFLALFFVWRTWAPTMWMSSVTSFWTMILRLMYLPCFVVSSTVWGTFCSGL